MAQKPIIRKLLKIAAITSPLIALFTFMPGLLTSINEMNTQTPGQARMVIGVLFLTIVIFLLWMINIGLYQFFVKRNFNTKNHRVIRYAISFLFCYLLLLVILSLPKPPNIRSQHLSTFSQLLIPIIGISANNAILLVILDLVVARDRKAKMELEIANITLSNVIAQKEQLKGQIHPHFLFNSLSTLKTLVKDSNVDAEKYIMNLSGFLRNSLSYSGEDKASLESELKHCIEYLEIQKIRFTNSLKYTVSIPPEIQQTFYLPVFSLQILVENAIKHNRLTKEKPLHIEIYQEKEGVICVRNSLNLKSNTETTGLGLNNLSKRIKLLGDSELDICIERTENTFNVTVPLFEK
ncbi:MAG: sensor histidine kinase [Bacteroidia bacterium]